VKGEDGRALIDKGYGGTFQVFTVVGSPGSYIEIEKPVTPDLFETLDAAFSFIVKFWRDGK
jgi:hypothetical protein